MTRYLMYGGKGGVGKTTTAAATARHIAGRGSRTLVVSTDPAHSLGDVFEREVGPDPTPVDEERPLFGVEVDPGHRLDSEYAGAVDDVLAEARRFGLDVDPGAFEGVSADSVVGSGELAVVDLLARYRESEEWDYVVFDTAPTGHTLQLLRLPEVLDSAVGTLLEVKSRVDTVRDALTSVFASDEERSDGLDTEDVDGVRTLLERARTALREETRFRPVMEPERLSLLETERLVATLHDHGVGVDVVVANKVLTDIDEDCRLCSQRRDRQQSVLGEADERIEAPIVTVPLLADPDGSAALDRVAGALATADR